MIAHNSAQTYTQPVADYGVRQNIARHSQVEAASDTRMYKAAGKIALAVFAVTIAVNGLFGLYKGHLETASAVVDQQRHELMDQNIMLRAQRAMMLTPAAVEVAAGKSLSLYQPGEGQRYVYNRRKGRFDRK